MGTPVARGCTQEVTPKGTRQLLVTEKMSNLEALVLLPRSQYITWYEARRRERGGAGSKGKCRNGIGRVACYWDLAGVFCRARRDLTSLGLCLSTRAIIFIRLLCLH